MNNVDLKKKKKTILEKVISNQLKLHNKEVSV